MLGGIERVVHAVSRVHALSLRGTAVSARTAVSQNTDAGSEPPGRREFVHRIGGICRDMLIGCWTLPEHGRVQM